MSDTSEGTRGTDRLGLVEIVAPQLNFLAEKKAGCAFAAIAANNPEQYGWYHRLLSPRPEFIDAEITEAIAERNITTLSLIFPEVDSRGKLPLTLHKFSLLGDFRRLSVLASNATAHHGRLDLRTY